LRLALKTLKKLKKKKARIKGRKAAAATEKAKNHLIRTIFRTSIKSSILNPMTMTAQILGRTVK
jgi:hypothetical protein